VSCVEVSFESVRITRRTIKKPEPIAFSAAIPNAIIRDIQPKASHVGAATTGASINVELVKKPSGCVIWMFF
jgi:hypothetical protein